MLTAAQIEEKSNQQKRTGFDKWMKQPMVRAMISMIPPSENKDLVHMALQAAWESGFESGVGVGMLLVIESIMREPRRP